MSGDSSRPATDRPIATALRFLLGGVAVAFVVGALAAAVLRVSYPFPLEWMEGGVVLHVRRVLAGRPLYVEPSVEFTPFIYPPLYYYVSAGVAAVTGLGFLPLRIVSLSATVGCFAAIGGLVRRETGSVLPAITAVGLFAATYPLVGTWFDLARVDTLFLALTLAGIAVVRFGRRPAAGAVAGVVFALAFLAKQSALLILAPLAVYALVHRRRFGLAFCAVAAGSIGTSTVVYAAVTDGWFLYYLFALPTEHDLTTGRLVTFWTADFLPPVVVAAGLAVATVAHGLLRDRAPVAHFYAVVLLALVGASWQARLHAGGWLNTLLPAYAGVAIVTGLAVEKASTAARAIESERSRRSSRAFEVLVLALLLVQFASLGYAPQEYVPSETDRREARAVEREIGALDRPTFSPIFPYVAVRTGDEPVAHKMALVDVLRAGPHDAREALRADVTRTMEDRRYRSLLLYNREHPLANFTRGYRYAGPVGNSSRALVPVTGVRIYPRYVYRPANGTAGEGSS